MCVDGLEGHRPLDRGWGSLALPLSPLSLPDTHSCLRFRGNFEQTWVIKRESKLWPEAILVYKTLARNNVE